MRRRPYHETGHFIGYSTTKNIPLTKRTGVIAAVVLGLMGVAFAAVGVAWWQGTRSFVQTAERTEGTVVELLERQSTSRSSNGRRSTSISFSPVVEYTDHQGKQHKHYSTTSTNPPMYSVGDKVPMLFDPNRPAVAKIDHWVNLYLAPIVFTVLGAVFLLVTIIMVFIAARPKSAEAENREPDEEDPAAMPE